MSTAVVVISCKRYERLWDPFFKLLNKYWNDCKYKIYFITDFGRYEDERVTNIELKKDMGFSANLITALKQIPEDNIIYFQEDYFAMDYFDNEKIERLVKHLEDYNISCLRLAPCPGPTAKWEHSEEVGLLQKGDSYRISTQTAIWNKNYLISILDPNETGWDFEILGTIRSCSRNDILLSVWRQSNNTPGGPAPYFITAIVKGIWQDGAIKLLEKEGLSTDNIKDYK